MKNIEVNLKKQILEIYSDLEESQIEFEKPNDSSHGDLSTNIAMKLAGKLQKNPREIANEIVEELSTKDDSQIDKIEIAGSGFINFYFANDIYASAIDEVLDRGEKFGSNQCWEDKTILIEHTSPNPNKAFHLGHLKNNVTGLAISLMFEQMGAKVVRDAIDNNRGIAIAKMMWGYLKFAKTNEEDPTDLEFWFNNQDKWLEPKENENPARFIGKYYVLGNTDFKNPEIEEKVRQMVIDWEAGEQMNRALWKVTQDWIWDGVRETLERINGWRFDKIWHEHEIYQKGKDHTERGVEEGIFKKLKDGAILTNFKKEFGIPDTILIKRDGTSLYITQDLELTRLKKETFKADEMFWVIGPEQSLAMKQAFAAASQLGFGDFEDFHHIAYGFISIKDKESGGAKKMSSREGNVIFVDDLIDEAKEQIKGFITSDFKDVEIENISEKLAIGAIKYSLLKVTRTQDMVFDFDSTISFEGDSAPYINYTYSRALSVLSEANESPDQASNDGSVTPLKEPEEIEIAKLISEFPNIVKLAAEKYAPNIICNYVYDLARGFNSFYNKHSILKADNEEQKSSRLKLTKATSIVIKNAMGLLNIELVERM